MAATLEKSKSEKSAVPDNRFIRSLRDDPALHRRILKAINSAVRAEDLLDTGPVRAHVEGEGAPVDDHGPAVIEPKAAARAAKLRAERLQIAADILAFRDREFPLGLRHIREIDYERFGGVRFPDVFVHLTRAFLGQWADFPVDIPRRGPGGETGIIHAALCRTGKVLFVTADETTLLWNPADTTPASFDNPMNQPHLMPGGYSQLCGHHVFLSDGRLLSVGGGGYGPNGLARAGYIFDPEYRTWTRTSNDMSEAKWYPTAVALGDERVLVTCGNRGGQMDIYSESTGTFTPVTGDTRGFPNLYPGLHLLPNHAVFYSRTGWGSAGAGGSGTNDSPSGYFTPTGGPSGVWTNIAASGSNRTKGMSAMILANTPPYVRVIVLGGIGGDQTSYETVDVSAVSGATAWSAPIPFPDGQARSLASAVLLPDGSVFVCGGVASTNSPCASFDPAASTWSARAELPSVRDYHSAALLLPSGQVMMAGWRNTKIEIFDPPYMFRGARPVISGSPALVHHGQTFAITSPDAATITKVVLVRPMAVTHQTDTEQKVIEMANAHDHANPDQIRVTAPDGGHPHSYAQKGHYMMFALNAKGVPSVARWVFLH
jgi:hypothetical protein